MATNKLIPYEATHPGILLRDELLARKMSQKELSSLLGVTPTFLNEIIKGKRPVTADFALLLEKALEISAEYWMRFQSQYELDKAALKEKNIRKMENITTWNFIKELVPVKEFARLGYLKDDIEANIRKLYEVYAVSSIEQLVGLQAKHKANAYYRKSSKLQVNANNIFAWSALAKYEADRMNVAAFNPDKLETLVDGLKSIFFENKNVVSQTSAILSNYGIKFVQLNRFDSTPVDGYSFWSVNNPAVALSLRHKRIDNFAFTLMHEIGHIALHLQNNKEMSFIDNMESGQAELLGQEEQFEQEANQFAREHLISNPQWQEFKSDFRPWNDHNYNLFGNKYKIHPAILFGRASFESSIFAVKTTIDRNLCI